MATAKQKAPSASLELKGGSVAARVGVTWANGTLMFNGKKYPVTVTGVNVVDVGGTTVRASGKVYNLMKLETSTAPTRLSAPAARSAKVGASWR